MSDQPKMRPKLMVTQVTMNPTGQPGSYSAMVMFGLSGFSAGAGAVPWIQIPVTNVRTPEEATAKAHDPVVAFSDELRQAADDLRDSSPSKPG